MGVMFRSEMKNGERCLVERNVPLACHGRPEMFRARARVPGTEFRRCNLKLGSGVGRSKFQERQRDPLCKLHIYDMAAYNMAELWSESPLPLSAIRLELTRVGDLENNPWRLFGAGNDRAS